MSSPRKQKQKPTKDGHFRTTITIDPAVWQIGVKLARRNRRNFSNYVEYLIDAAHKQGVA